MRLIKLTRAHQDPSWKEIWLNVVSIDVIFRQFAEGKNARVCMRNSEDYYDVEETPEQIIDLIKAAE